MTLLHFINCVGLASAPYLITYRFSGLSEYSAFWRCIKAGAAYFVTQIVKMLVLASFFPIVEEEENATMLVECAKCTVDLIDLLGLYIVLNKILGKVEMKVLVVAVGWGGAELLATKLLPLWFGARGVEFEWKYIQSSLDSNISLLFLLSTCGLLWLLTRNDFNRTYLPYVLTLLIAICYRPLLFILAKNAVNLSVWVLLLAKAAAATLVGVLTLQLCRALAV